MPRGVWATARPLALCLAAGLSAEVLEGRVAEAAPHATGQPATKTLNRPPQGRPLGWSSQP